MRSKPEIVRLQARYDRGVEFPKDRSPSFETYNNQLLDVLRDNGLGGDWDYDPDSGEYGCQWSRDKYGLTVLGTVLPSYTGHIGVTFRTNVALDPKKPLIEEIARLLAEKQAFEDRTDRMHRLLVVEEAKMAQAQAEAANG